MSDRAADRPIKRRRIMDLRRCAQASVGGSPWVPFQEKREHLRGENSSHL